MNKVALYAIVLYCSVVSGIAFGDNLSLGTTYYLDPGRLEIFTVLDVESRPNEFDNNILRIRGYVVNGQHGEVSRIYPSVGDLKKHADDDAITIVPENKSVGDKLSGITNPSCVLMAGIFTAYTKNFIGSGNAANKYGILFVSHVSSCLLHKHGNDSRVSQVDLKTLNIRNRQPFSQLYLAGDGALVFATNGGCEYNEMCQSYVVRGAAIAVHVGGTVRTSKEPVAASMVRARELAQSMPGAGDANLLRAYQTVLFVSRRGERYVMKITDGKSRAEYIGGGEGSWGNYVEHVWQPNQPQGWYVDRATKFLHGYGG